MFSRLVLLFVASLAASTAQAQHCKKGIPCGNSCISATKTCHKGAGTAWGGPSESPTPAATRRRAVDPPSPPLNPRLETDGGYAVADSLAPYVASLSARTFMARTCIALRYVDRFDRRFYRDSLDAMKAGFTHARGDGC
jgi:hypothetical protein